MGWIIGIAVVLAGLVVAAVVVVRKRKELDAEEEAEAGEDVAGIEDLPVYVPQQRADEDLEDEIRSSPSHALREQRRAYLRRRDLGEDEPVWIADSSYNAAGAALADFDGDGVPDAFEPDPFVYDPARNELTLVDEDQLTKVDLHPVDETRDDWAPGPGTTDSGYCDEADPSPASSPVPEPQCAPEPALTFIPDPPSYSAPDSTPSYTSDPSPSSYDSGSSSSDSGSYGG